MSLLKEFFVCSVVIAGTDAKHNVIAVKSICRPAPEGCESKASVLEQQYKSVTKLLHSLVQC